MIVCDVCWCVMGKSDEYEDLINNSLHWIGRWNVCSECLDRYVKDVEKDVLSKRFKKN